MKIKNLAVISVSLALLLMLAGCSQFTEQNIIIDFHWVPTMPIVGESVTFEANVSAVEGEVTEPISYDWKKGNTAIGTTKQITYTFPGAGEFDITLSVTVGGKEQKDTTKTITIKDSKVQASFTSDPEFRPTKDQYVTFNASSSKIVAAESNGNSINDLYFGWDFDDDDQIDKTGEIVEYKFGSKGEKVVTLFVSTEDINVGDDMGSVDWEANEWDKVVKSYDVQKQALKLLTWTKHETDDDYVEGEVRNLTGNTYTKCVAKLEWEDKNSSCSGSLDLIFSISKNDPLKPNGIAGFYGYQDALEGKNIEVNELKVKYCK